MKLRYDGFGINAANGERIATFYARIGEDDATRARIARQIVAADAALEVLRDLRRAVADQASMGGRAPEWVLELAGHASGVLDRVDGVEQVELEVCVDCSYWIANGEHPDGAPREWSPDRLARAWPAADGWDVMNGDGEGREFTAAECDGCGSALAGARASAVAVRKHPHAERIEYINACGEV